MANRGLVSGEANGWVEPCGSAATAQSARPEVRGIRRCRAVAPMRVTRTQSKLRHVWKENSDYATDGVAKGG